MNKEEAKQKLHNLAFAKLNAKPDDLKLADVMRIVNQIYEPQKPVVPQFVADWYEKHKNSLEFNIFDYVYRFDQNEESDLKDWFDDINTNAFQTLVNMHQFGYEIEKEAKYTVKVKATKQYLCNDELGPQFSPSFRSNFTKTNLEELGFGWVFSCEGVEIEEVE
nr:MAG TPA: Protein of unknown function (DUF1642) [Caudoviricetes sp.]